MARGMVLRLSLSGYLSTLLTKQKFSLDSLEEDVRIDEDDLVGYNNEQLPSSVCEVILRRNGGPGVVRVLGKTIEVIQADSKHQGPSGMGNLVLMVKKPGATGHLYGTLSISYQRRILVFRAIT